MAIRNIKYLLKITPNKSLTQIHNEKKKVRWDGRRWLSWSNHSVILLDQCLHWPWPNLIITINPHWHRHRHRMLKPYPCNDRNTLFAESCLHLLTRCGGSTNITCIRKSFINNIYISGVEMWSCGAAGPKYLFLNLCLLSLFFQLWGKKLHLAASV